MKNQNMKKTGYKRPRIKLCRNSCRKLGYEKKQDMEKPGYEKNQNMKKTGH